MNDILSVGEQEVGGGFDALKAQGLICLASRTTADLLEQEHPKGTIKTDHMVVYPGRNHFMYFMNIYGQRLLLPMELVKRYELTDVGNNGFRLIGTVEVSCQGSNLTFLFHDIEYLEYIKSFLKQELKGKGNYRVFLPGDAFVLYNN